jgi:glycosyltransferase involved in cell wall biosynthesis
VYAFDDAIWERPGKRRSFWSRTRLDWRLKSAWANADVVTTCSEYLASYARPYAKKLMVIPIAIARPDASKPSSARTLDPRWIGWSGHPSGHDRLKSIDAALAAFLAKHPNFGMLVLSGSRPDLNAPFEWLNWNLQAEARYLARVSIGVVPLENEAIDRGKSPVRIIQHLAQGVPVVTNGLGGTEEIASGGGVVHVDGSLTSWVDALATLACDPIEYARIASDGVRNFEANYDVAVARQRFLSAFQIRPAQTIELEAGL